MHSCACTMTSSAVDTAPMGKDAGDSMAAKQTGLQEDVEVGPEVIDIDRIERVYA